MLHLARRFRLLPDLVCRFPSQLQSSTSENQDADKMSLGISRLRGREIPTQMRDAAEPRMEFREVGVERTKWKPELVMR
jgi:hypothetical protein